MEQSYAIVTTPYKNLDVTYDFVAIVDFLPVGQRRAYGLSERLCRLLERNRIVWERADCATAQGFVGALLNFAHQSKKERSFALQFIGHGETDGLVMPDGKLLRWVNIAPVFRQFNPRILGGCILNLSCCFGLHGIKLTDHLPEAERFFGLLGPARRIGFGEALKINSKVYRKWASGKRINDIIREVNKEFGESVLYGLTTSGYHALKKTA
jgi:hypothetical protein